MRHERSIRASGRRAGRAARLAAAVALLAGGAGLLWSGCGRSRPAYRPNVLIVLVDALRADRLGVHGYPLPVTPEIDRLAAEGVSFSSAFAHSTWTKASIATLFTSLYPSQHGIDRVGFFDEGGFSTDLLSEELTTLAEAFRAGGYATGAEVNQVHLKARFGFAQGFDHYEAVRGRDARWLNGKLGDWLAGLEGRPFFAYLHYLDTHWPYTRRVRDRKIGPTEMESEPPKRGDAAKEWARGEISAADVAALAARYDHEVAWTDAALGQLVERLRELGLYEDTLIVVTSDHGEGFFEHGLIQHGYAPYDELLRVPLVLRLPEPLRAETGVIDGLVGLIDLMPTLLDLAGLEPAAQAQGRSLRGLLAGRRSSGRLIFAETREAAALRGSADKLIRFVDGSEEYFDLAADPGEQRPGSCTGRCSALAARLDETLRVLAASRPAAGETAPMDAEEVEDLRSLGYL